MATDPYAFGPSMAGDNPYVFGAADPNAVDPTMSGSGNGTDWQGLFKAMQGFGGQQQAQRPAVSNLPGASGQAQAGQAQSGAYSGSAAGMNQLASMLMARVQALREASNPRAGAPVNLQSQQRPMGLLGL